MKVVKVRETVHLDKHFEYEFDDQYNIMSPLKPKESTPQAEVEGVKEVKPPSALYVSS